MNHQQATAWARLRSSMSNPGKRDKPGTCRVLIRDLELLLAEVEALSNAQMARHLVRIVLDELDGRPTSRRASACADTDRKL